MNPEILLACGFAVAAMLYASVGHGGASGYLAVMALAGFAPTEMRWMALWMNILVSGLATLMFLRYFRWGLFWPFSLAAIPCAWIGGMVEVTPTAFYWLVGFALLAAAIRLFVPDGGNDSKPLCLPVAVVSGAIIGIVSGLVGVGGGIFLTPLLMLSKWANPRQAAAVSAPFILLNSLAGIGGMHTSGNGGALPNGLLLYGTAAVLGGLFGGWWGSFQARPAWLRPTLAVVLMVAAFKFGDLALS